MSKTNILPPACIACFLLLVTGAPNSRSHHPPLLSTPTVGAETASLIGTPNDWTANQILARAAANLAPEKTPWLRLTTWQKQDLGEVSFEAKGRLVRGPNQCARLELTVYGKQAPAEIVTVSDGVGLAHAHHRPGQRVRLTTQRFTAATNKPMTHEEIENILHAHGCGGPYRLLKDLASTLQNSQMAPVLWKNKSVIQITGCVIEASSEGSPAAARICRVFLDVDTLWPHRVEWGTNGEGNLALQLEFRDPQINQPLSHEDCAREFTYLPN